MLTDPTIKLQIRDAVDAFCCREYEKGPRGHLGASEIGKECWRAIWYKFRFVDHKVHVGRIHRLFQRGHEEEPRVKRWLQGVGCKFADIKLWHHPTKGYFWAWFCDDPAYTEVGPSGPHIPASFVPHKPDNPQLNFKSLGGHFSGSCDGVLTLPAWCGYDKPVLWENKTFGGELGDKKDFLKLSEVGVQWVKPEHWAQMQMYMWEFDLEYALYTAVQKSTDEIYYEFVMGAPEFAAGLQDKAKAIIYAEAAPPKISAKGCADYRCRFCDHKEVCHLGKEILRSCRSCQNCKPVDNEGWECSVYGLVPKEYVGLPTDCGQWKGVC